MGIEGHETMTEGENLTQKGLLAHTVSLFVISVSVGPYDRCLPDFVALYSHGGSYNLSSSPSSLHVAYGCVAFCSCGTSNNGSECVL